MPNNPQLNQQDKRSSQQSQQERDRMAERNPSSKEDKSSGSQDRA